MLKKQMEVCMIIKSNYPYLEQGLINALYDELYEDGETLEEIQLFLEQSNFHELCKHGFSKWIGDDEDNGQFGALHVYDEFKDEWIDITYQTRVLDRKWDLLRKENTERLERMA